MCIKKSAVLAKANSKIFLCADCPVSLSPKGAALSPKYCVRFFRISLRLVLQKSALSLNEIAASKFKLVIWCGDNSQFGFSPIFLKDRKELIGYGGIMPFRDGYEFGYIIAKKYWGRGYGLEIAKAQLDFIQNRLKAKAYATSHPKNLASIKILEKLGLKLISVENLNRGKRNIYAN